MQMRNFIVRLVIRTKMILAIVFAFRLSRNSDRYAFRLNISPNSKFLALVVLELLHLQISSNEKENIKKQRTKKKKKNRKKMRTKKVSEFQKFKCGSLKYQRWSRGHKARDQGQGHKKNPKPRTAFPRTDPLEAKERNARGQGHRCNFSPKKNVFKQFFRRSPKQEYKKGLRNFPRGFWRFPTKF